MYIPTQCDPEAAAKAIFAPRPGQSAPGPQEGMHVLPVVFPVQLTFFFKKAQFLSKDQHGMQDTL